MKEFLLKQSLKIKLTLLTVSLLSVSLVVGLVTYYGITQIERDIKQIKEETFPKVLLLQKMYLDYKEIRINLRSLGLEGLDESQASEKINQSLYFINRFETTLGELKKMPLYDDEKKLQSEVVEDWKKFKSIGERVLALQKISTPEAKSEKLKIFLKDCPEAAKNFDFSITQLENIFERNGQQYVTSAYDSSRSTFQKILISIALGILIGFTFARMLSNFISKSIDELVSRLKESVTNVNISSTEIAKSSETLSLSSSKQAASLEETSATLEELIAMVSKNTENAKNTALESSETLQFANQGKIAVEKMQTAMGEIDTSNAEILEEVKKGNDDLKNIVSVISEIADKTKVINDIAFQTKLLSFNASVEAARAGENGKGFSVVAEEIGNLASMSGNAAQEISHLLNSSIKKVDDIVTETQNNVHKLIIKGKEKVEIGVHVANESMSALDEILHKVASVNSMSQEIAIASQEQALGISEINKAVAELDSVTQNNAHMSNESSSLATNLFEQAKSMDYLVEDFVVLVKGKS